MDPSKASAPLSNFSLLIPLIGGIVSGTLFVYLYYLDRLRGRGKAIFSLVVTTTGVLISTLIGVIAFTETSTWRKIFDQNEIFHQKGVTIIACFVMGLIFGSTVPLGALSSARSAVVKGHKSGKQQVRLESYVLILSVVWFVNIIIPFVLPPPYEVGSDSAKQLSWLCVVLVVIVQLTLLLSKRSSLKHVKIWPALAILAFAFGTLAFFQYQHLRSTLSVSYSGGRVVIGSEFTPEGEAYRKGESGFTNAQAVMDAAGHPAKIWTADSIHGNAMRLYVAYFAVVIFIALAAISAIQGFYTEKNGRPIIKTVSTPIGHRQLPTPGSESTGVKIFLCHSSGDKAVVRELYRRLKADGQRPWLDEENLVAGQDWNLEISRAVRSSDAVVVCLSGQSVAKSGYVQKEIKQILDVADEQPEGKIFIIPLRLEECEIPSRLAKWQWVNYYEEGGYEKLKQALEVLSRAAGGDIRTPATS